jgi:tetratricopeptide (TPR) repeat protein
MGIVYKARHVVLPRDVALKMILAGGLGRAEHLARFRLEAEAVARLQHPNVVQIFEVGEEGGCPYLVLEFVAGGSLDRKIAGTPQAARASAELVATLARTMHAAHQQNIVHRDLKPANVLLQRKAETEDTTSPSDSGFRIADFEPKISDFGLAKHLDDSQGPTHEGAIMGSPPYMAPEQAAGNVRAIGPLTDVYALAAILYELLTGRPPFKGATVHDTLMQVRTREPVAVRQLRPDVPRDLETICLKGLQKDPAKRYGSALALAEDLQRFLDGRPILARPASTWEKAVKWVRRRPTQAALAGTALVAVLGLGAGGVSYGLYKDLQWRHQEAELQAQEGRRQEVGRLWSLAEQAEEKKDFQAATEYWAQCLNTIDQERDGPPDERRPAVVRRLESVRARVEKETARHNAQQAAASFRKPCSDVLLHEINVGEQDGVANRAAICKEAPAALDLLGLSVDHGAVDVQSALGPYRDLLASRSEFEDLAGGCYRVLLVWADAEATPLPEEGAAERSRRARKALRRLAIAADLAQVCELPSPQIYHLRKARYLSQVGDKEGARLEQATANQVQPDSPLDRFQSALDHYRRQEFGPAAADCLEVLRRQPGDFWAQYLQALCHMKMNRWGEARVGLTTCVHLHPDFPWPRMLRAVAHTKLGELDLAEADFKEALSLEKDPFFRAYTLTNQSALRLRQGSWQAAVKDLEAAIDLPVKCYLAHVNLAGIYQKRKEWNKAVAALKQAIAQRPGDAWLHYNLAHLYLEARNPTDARVEFKEYIALEPKGGKSERLASAWTELGHLRHVAREYDEALKAFENAFEAFPDYAPAHRERAVTLLALKRDAEAGEALDRFLRRERGTPRIYQARGRIHVQLGEHARAVEAFTHALQEYQDVATLTSRGWSYLEIGATQPALADFENALALDAQNSDALCGRGLARVLLGQVREAVADADDAVKQGPGTASLLFSAACVHAQAVGRLEARLRGRAVSLKDRDLVQELNASRARAVELLEAALRKVDREERAAFWKKNVKGEATLAPIRRDIAPLALKYDR